MLVTIAKIFHTTFHQLNYGLIKVVSSESFFQGQMPLSNLKYYINVCDFYRTNFSLSLSVCVCLGYRTSTVVP